MEGTEGEDKGKREQKSVKKRGKSSGARCMVMHCSTTSQDGIPVHAMPGPMPSSRVERFSSLQMAWINFIRTKRVFDPYSCKTIIVCGLHFNESDYEPSHVRMHKMGFRKLPPRLLPNAVPHIFHAPAAATGGGSTDTAAATMTNLASGPQVTPSPQSSTLPQFSLPQSASTSDQSVEAMDTSGDEPPGPPDELDDMDTTAAPRPRPKTVKRKSSYSRKKEVAGITEEYRMKALMDRAKEILGRSKGVQCSVKMVNRKVGFRKYKRTCRVSVRPMTVSKRTLVNVAAQKFPIPQLCDASTQTEKRPAQVHHVEEAEEHGEDEEAINDDDDDDRAMKDDEKNDPSYKPGGSNEKLSPKEHTAPKLTNLAGEKKFIVFESNLLELFSTCTNCLSTNIDIKRQHSKSFGSMVKIIATCEDCNESRVWSSQPRVGNLPAGNLLLSASILFGGGSPTKILRILRNMNVQAISVNTFLEHQREFLQPAIVRVWRRQQQALFDAVGEDEKLVIGGDGRADSPGHSAKYGSYTFMDMNRNKIVHMELVQSSEVSSSNAMEKEGLKRGLEELQNHGITVGTLITDRHASVAKFIRENYQGITHKYDGWHIAKGVTKKITAVGKLKDCEAALLWKRSINNHIYWCASSTPDGDGELIAAKFLSILNHVRNVHVGHHEKFQQCAHGENYGQREWMKQGTKVFEKVSDVMTKTRLVNDIKKMSPLEQTSSVESFHSVLLYWCPKMLAYSYTGIKCRLYLAVMHWNENAHRSQATNAAGKPIFKISYPKAKEGGHTVSKVLTSCTYDYVASLMEETLQLASQKQKLRAEIPELQGKPPLCAGVDRISKDEAIEQLEAHRRFAKM